MKIGIIGSGVVAQTLGAGFLTNGYEVILGTRNPDKLKDWKANFGKNLEIGSFEDTAKKGEIIVLAVQGKSAVSAIELCKPENLKNKTVMDATNPISDLPPANGVLNYFTDQNGSLMEQLQEKFPEINFVKAFNSVGYAFMINPDFGGLRPTMFYAGNNESAKFQVRAIIEMFGWEPEDMGKAEAARAIEPLCMLWCIPGLRENKWSHAFKLLKK